LAVPVSYESGPLIILDLTQARFQAATKIIDNLPGYDPVILLETVESAPLLFSDLRRVLCIRMM
jgi:hypothetical protein